MAKNKIIAFGTYIGVYGQYEVEMEDNKPVIRHEGALIPEATADFEKHLDNPMPMGGTYYPERNTLLNAYGVLEKLFFDDNPELITLGEIGEIPDDGEIY